MLLSNTFSVLRRLVTLLVLGVVVSAPIGGDAAEPLQIRVLCYNIHHGAGVDGELDLPRIARVIRSVDPTIVALQEVDCKTQRTRQVDQPAELARLTNMKVLFEKNIEFEGGEYGNAVLTKLPIVAHRNVHLPSLDDGEQRGALIVELKADSAQQRLVFICTHLDHRSDGKERLASAQKINELIVPYGDLPAILAGDMNATRDSDTIAALKTRWEHVSEKEQPTIPVAKPNRQIDFILVRPKSRWRTVESRVLDEAVASDHRAIFAVLELVLE